MQIEHQKRVIVKQKWINSNPRLIINFKGKTFVVNHNELLSKVLSRIQNTASWNHHGYYSWPYLGEEMAEIMKPYEVSNA